MRSTSPETRPKRSLNSPRSAEYKVLLDEGQSLMRIADGPLISVDVRDGVVLVGEGVNFDSEGEVSDGVDFDFVGDFSEAVDFDSDGNVSEGDLTARSRFLTGPPYLRFVLMQMEMENFRRRLHPFNFLQQSFLLCLRPRHRGPQLQLSL